MRTWRTFIDNERGMALMLALMVLLALTGLVLAFLTVSAYEPQIAKNVTDTARARYLAEAGVEAGFNMLVNTSDLGNTFSPALVGASAGAPWVTLINNGTFAGVTPGGAAAEAAYAGTYNVMVRNDAVTADSEFTGMAAGGNAVPAETPTGDTNKVVIMRATGTFRGATKVIEVVVRRGQLPPFPGAVNLPGVQTDTFINKQTFDIDGRDYTCSVSCDTAANWTQNASNPNKYGIATGNGTQSNIGVSYENNVQNALASSGSCSASCASAKQASVKGRDETVTGGGAGSSFVNGFNTIQGDTVLNPTNIAAYIDSVRNYAGTTVLQSTPSCPMQLTGTGAGTNRPQLTNGCTGAAGVNRPLDLGTRQDPKLVFFKGALDPSSMFTGLQLNGGIKGAGILIIEDGDVKNFGDFTWDGVVIVTGSYVGSGFMANSNTTIRGALVANETKPGEVSGFFEFYLHGNASSLSIRNSQQNIDMVQLMKGNHTLTNWREL